MIKVINNEELNQFLQKLSQNHEIIAPVIKNKGSKELVEYEEVSDFSKINLEAKPDTSPKELFLPQNEKIEAGNDRGGKRIIFGVHSCDIEALKVFDSVFLGATYVDPYYKERRENTVIFGLSCQDRFKSCFCDSLGIDPVENSDVPFYIYKFGEEYWIKSMNNEYTDLIKDLPDGNKETLTANVENRRNNFSGTEFAMEISLPLAESELFTAPIWEDIAAKCLGCGVCTYYCPTCFCFGFFWDDEKWRNWDSCMFSLFTLHASGHNPRETQDQRWRQRLMHKFSYHPENYGEQLACVGCGRCVNRCPVKLDIRKALKIAENYLKEQGGTE